MRRIAVIVFFFFVLPLKAQGVYPNILERDSFPGVKSLEISGYLLQWDENLDTMFIPLTQSGFVFNESGSWVTRGGVFPGGDVSFDSTWYYAKTRTKYIRSQNDFDPSLTTITYNKKGKVLTELYAPERHEQTLTEFEYNKSGKLIRKSICFTGQKTVEEYTYDKNGNLLTRRSLTGSINGTEPVLDAELFYTWNSSGKCVRMVGLFYGASGGVQSRDTVWYEYNTPGLLVQQKESRGNGNSTTLTTWEYDEKGRTTLLVYKYNDLEGNYDEVTTRIEYDSLGYCKHFSDDGSGYGFSLNWNTTYNEKGLPDLCFYTTESEIIMYKWEYVYQ